jgi:hypothetical protein
MRFAGQRQGGCTIPGSASPTANRYPLAAITCYFGSLAST